MTKQMKTKRMITLLAALLVGVLVNAQSIVSDVNSAQDQIQQDNLKMMVMEYGADLSILFSQLSVEQEEAVKTIVDKCKNGQENSDSCTQAIKKGAKLFPFFQHWPDSEDQTERTN